MGPEIFQMVIDSYWNSREFDRSAQRCSASLKRYNICFALVGRSVPHNNCVQVISLTAKLNFQKMKEISKIGKFDCFLWLHLKWSNQVTNVPQLMKEIMEPLMIPRLNFLSWITRCTVGGMVRGSFWQQSREIMAESSKDLRWVICHFRHDVLRIIQWT